MDNISALLIAFTLGMVAFFILYTASEDIRQQNSLAASEVVITDLHYGKDTKGNCYAILPYSKAITWIPCEEKTCR